MFRGLPQTGTIAVVSGAPQYQPKPRSGCKRRHQCGRYRMQPLPDRLRQDQ